MKKLFTIALILVLTISSANAQQFTPFAEVFAAGGLAFDSNGFLLVTSQDSGNLYKISPSGDTSTFVSGLSTPERLVFARDGSGDVFVTQYLASTVSRVTPAGAVSFYATVTSAFGITADSSGNLYVGNYFEGRIAKVSPGGVVTTLASGFSSPLGLEYYNGFVYVCNTNANIIQKVSVTDGTVSTFVPFIQRPRSIRLSKARDCFYQSDYENGAINKISFDGAVTLYADGFVRPADIAFDASGHMFVSDFLVSVVYKSVNIVGINSAGSTVPDGFSLSQNYPNPFNPSTVIDYEVASKSFVSIKVYDALGRMVSELGNEIKPAGKHQVIFESAGLANGVYFYSLFADETMIDTKRMIIVK